MPRLLANWSLIVTNIRMLRIISCRNEMNASWGFIWQQKDKQQHGVPANWGAAIIESACRIQSNVMAGNVGSPNIDSYLYSQKLPVLNSNFHYDLYFMHFCDWALVEIRYCLYMICDELQVFKICGGRELAGHRLSRWASTGIQIISLRALLMEIGS
jgi:hypothetical protein